MLELLLASSNSHKAEEFKILLPSEYFSVLASPEKLEVIEDGETFEENALIKAKAYYDKYKSPILADDSGLVVTSLPNELGIHSARFGGDGLNDSGRCDILLDKLNEAEDRSAYFVCVLCFYLSPKEYFFFEGRLSGEILKQAKGDKGFGYDPIFTGQGQTLGESIAENPDWKAKNSHRAAASSFATRFFKERICQNILN